MEKKIQDSKVYWNNTQKAFKSQHTQLENKIAQAENEIKTALSSEYPPIKRYIDCEVIYDSCKGKIGILEGYLPKLAGLATLAPDTDGDTVEARLGQADRF